jgi:acyl-coenzyme A synthetase/AMP-(fatty) acid ligase/3-hydroxymyristoyl/3-hydroxydecanoyl-(acyl carrier protein) dehydratase
VNTGLEWLQSGAAESMPVAFTDQGVKTRSDLRKDVSALLSVVQQHTAAECALWEPDSYRFLVAALAVMAAEKTLLLPPNTTTATTQALREQGVMMLDEVMAALPANAKAHENIPVQPAWQLSPQACIVLFTSGSTGAPKRIERRFAQLLQEVKTLQEVFGKRAHERTVLATVSHQHIYGLLFKLLWPLTTGRAFLSAQCEYPEQLQQALAEHPQALLVSSPALLKRWPGDMPLPVPTIFSSGGLLPAATRQYLQPLYEGELIEVLGSSETGGIAWRNHAAGHWQTFSDVEFRITAEAALEVRTAHACQPQWLATGDSAQASDGGFHLGSRQDRLVKLEEKRISLDAVETALRHLDEVSDVHVLLTSRASREEIAAIIVPSASGYALLSESGKSAFSRHLRRSLRTQLEALALPRRWRFISALPVNTQGKLDRITMEKMFAGAPLLPEILSLQNAGNALLISARVPETLQYFEGHFPQAPVVAGVAQIAWVAHFAREHLGLQGDFSGMEQLKFQQLLRPATEFTMHIEYQREKSRLIFRLSREENNYSSGRLVYARTVSATESI